MPVFEREVGEAQDFGTAGRRVAPEERADAGQQLLKGEGLDEVVVRAGIQTLHAVAHIVARGQHEHGHIAGVAQPFADFKPVQAGQHPVQDDQIRRVVARQFQPAVAVVGHDRPVVFEYQAALDEAGDRHFILNHQNSFAGHGSPSLCQWGLSSRPQYSEIV